MSSNTDTVQTSGLRSLLELLPQMRRVRVEDLDALRTAAAADDHKVIAPTHLVLRHQEIVGYASIGALMLVNAWVKTGEVRPRESAYLLNLVENIAAEKGARAIVMPCAEDSPFLPHMPRLGYTPLGWASYNLKTVHP